MGTLKQLYQSQGFTQKTLAKKLNCSNTTISMWCTGKSKPNCEKISQLIKILKIDYETLFVALNIKTEV